MRKQHRAGERVSVPPIRAISLTRCWLILARYRMTSRTALTSARPVLRPGTRPAARVPDCAISQVVREIPYRGRIMAIQPRDANNSNIEPIAMRGLFRTCMGFDVRFALRGLLTLC